MLGVAQTFYVVIRHAFDKDRVQSRNSSDGPK